MSRSIKFTHGVLVALVAASAAGGATQALAAPAGACPTPYELFAIPTDGSRPVAAQADAKGNADGYACEKPRNDGSTYNVIDNRVQGGRGR